MVDKPRWAFDYCATQIALALKEDFDFEIKYVIKKPKIKAENYDLLYVFFWGEEYYKQFDFNPEKIIKEVSSHRWQDDPRYGPNTAMEFSHKYLSDASIVICTSRRLHGLLSACRPNTVHAENGFNPEQFRPIQKRNGALVIGWAGNINDPVKQVKEILLPACSENFVLKIANGDLKQKDMNRFYNDIDVFTVTSKHEGSPLPLIEAMAAGCFPVCVDVGIVPELIRNGENGLIVSPTIEAFEAAFHWCDSNKDFIRKAGEKNAEIIRNVRPWYKTADTFKVALSNALQIANKPKFRNDDVCWDTPLDRFRSFCEIFQKNGLTQLHAVTLRGQLSSRYTFNGEPAEYKNEVSMGKMSNDTIRKLSQNLDFTVRKELIDYLNSTNDNIALHGLYHTDYSMMSYDEQKADIILGLELLRKIFPKKPICYFVAPFNRTNTDTYRACRELGLTVLAKEGIHLESTLEELNFTPKTWYRYHHHRFYPESTFNYYALSLEALDTALTRGIQHSEFG
ncbi:glycosyltransferase [Methylomonas sp. 2BW1-5-20]|uniref:glycosyltransferase n=1 Tax=Methylomonas sp. 2BW1-5-20 TaxID=3376686 RepID=UPI00404F2A1A